MNWNFHTPTRVFIAFIRCSVREKLTSHPLSRQRRSLYIYVFFVDFTRFSADSFKALIQIKSNLVYFECVVLDNFFFLLRFRCCFMLLSADVVAVAVCCVFDSKLLETYWTNISRKITAEAENRRGGETHRHINQNFTCESHKSFEKENNVET